MPADLTKPFAPACCEGAAAANLNSAQPCGCDPGCGPRGYLCERHRSEPAAAALSVTSSTGPAKVAPVTSVATSPAPNSPEWRKQRPLWAGVLRYFPDALLEVAHVSWVGNQQHNPGMALHWDRSKSTDEPDACARHLVDAGTLDTDNTRHSAKVAWRALAMLQKEIEAERG